MHKSFFNMANLKLYTSQTQYVKEKKSEKRKLFE